MILYHLTWQCPRASAASDGEQAKNEVLGKKVEMRRKRKTRRNLLHTLNLPIAFSNPVFPLGRSVGMTMIYVRHVARTHLPSSVTSIPMMGSPNPGSVVFARGLRASIESAATERPSPNVFESKRRMSPRLVPTTTAPVSVVAAHLKQMRKEKERRGKGGASGNEKMGKMKRTIKKGQDTVIFRIIPAQSKNATFD
jgi:hypothetical protein